AHAFGRRRFDADSRDVDLQYLGDLRAHRLAMWCKLRRLADQRDIAMRDRTTGITSELRSVREKLIRRGTAPLRIGRRKVLPDIARTDRPKDRIRQRMQPRIGIRMSLEPVRVRDLHTAQ